MKTKHYWIGQCLTLGIFALSIFLDKIEYINESRSSNTFLLVFALIPNYFVYKNPELNANFRKQILVWSIALVILGVAYYFWS